MRRSLIIFRFVTAVATLVISCGKENEIKSDTSGDFLIKGVVDGAEVVYPTGTADLDSELCMLLAG